MVFVASLYAYGSGRHGRDDPGAANPGFETSLSDVHSPEFGWAGRVGRLSATSTMPQLVALMDCIMTCNHAWTSDEEH